MSSTPHTTRAFSRWYERSKHEWPADLAERGQRASLALTELENIKPADLKAMQDRESSALAHLLAAVVAFSEAYGTSRQEAAGRG